MTQSEYEVSMVFKNTKRYVSLEDVSHQKKLLELKEQYANDMLQSRGHLFLNEVLDMLDLPRIREGQSFGWVKDKNTKVSFGIDLFDDIEDPEDDTSSISLTFNVLGPIENLVWGDKK